jgi:putative flippase GtrA
VIRAFASRQFLLFIATGGVAAAVNFGSRIVYSRWLALPAAVLLAYLTGMVTAFVLARWLVFTGSTQATHRSALYFALVNVFAVAQTLLLTLLLARLLPALGVQRWVPEIAHAAGVMLPVFSSYLGHKHWSFRQEREADERG